MSENSALFSIPARTLSGLWGWRPIYIVFRSEDGSVPFTASHALLAFSHLEPVAEEPFRATDADSIERRNYQTERHNRPGGCPVSKLEVTSTDAGLAIDFTWVDATPVLALPTMTTARKVLINAELLIDNWRDSRTASTKTVIRNLKAGSHDILVEYYERVGNAEMKLEWEGPDIERQAIPKEALRATAADDASGRRTSMTTLDGMYAYGYDPLGQLTSVIHPGGRVVEYEYDAVGNRVEVIDDSASTP